MAEMAIYSLALVKTEPLLVTPLQVLNSLPWAEDIFLKAYSLVWLRNQGILLTVWTQVCAELQVLLIFIFWEQVSGIYPTQRFIR